MSWATQRKLLYFLVFFVVIILIVGLPAFFFFYKKPTCSDGKQNGGETGIDCGGSCQKLCRVEQLSPVVFWQQSFNVLGNTYSAVAYVQNPNPNGEVLNASYTFKFFDKNNVQIAEKRGATAIPAGRNFAVFESGIQIPADKELGRTQFEFDPDINWLVARKNLPQLRVINTIVSNASSTPSVDADIQNPSFGPIRTVEVTAIIYDDEGNAFAASKTFIDGISKVSSRHVVFTWPKPFEKSVSKVEIIPLIK